VTPAAARRRPVRRCRPLRIHGDRDLLFQALANLLDNAIKYTPAGGEIRIAPNAVGDGGVELSVADSGPGIPAELRGKVLQRFYRVDASRSEPGHGLGLSLVQAVAQLHDADLRLEDAGPGNQPALEIPDAVPALYSARRFRPASTLIQWMQTASNRQPLCCACCRT
jgi:signal transduction histidine kinase